MQSIDEADAVRLQAIAPWVRKANREITRRIADARAHAEQSRENRHPGYGRQQLKTAQDRLQELQQCLIGSGLGTMGLIQDARADFYRRARREWLQLIPPQVLHLRPELVAKEERQTRSMFLHGVSLLAEVEPEFVKTESQLRAATNAAQSQPGGSGHQTIDTWERQATSNLQGRILTVLSDSEVKIRDDVGRSLIKPELRSWTP